MVTPITSSHSAVGDTWANIITQPALYMHGKQFETPLSSQSDCRLHVDIPYVFPGSIDIPLVSTAKDPTFATQLLLLFAFRMGKYHITNWIYDLIYLISTYIRFHR
jgi:hypothetical protein